MVASASAHCLSSLPQLTVVVRARQWVASVMFIKTRNVSMRLLFIVGEY